MKKQIKKEKTTSQIETIATTAVSTVSSVASIATSYIPIYFVQNKKVEEKKDLSIVRLQNYMTSNYYLRVKSLSR